MRRLSWFMMMSLFALQARADSGEALFARLPQLELPELPEGTIAMGDDLVFTLAGITLASDTNEKRSSSELAGAGYQGGDDVYFNAAIKALYDSYLETESYAYRLTGMASFKAGTVDDDYEVRPWVLLSPRVKYYMVSDLFLHGLLDMDYQTYKVSDVDALNTFSIRAGLGMGFGRVFDIGQRQRLIAMEKALVKAHAMEGEIPSETGDKILLHLYALRNEIGYYKHLAYALKCLADDGLLLEEVDFSLAYKLLQILRDPSYDQRREGFEVWLDYAMYDEFIEEQVLAMGLVGFMEYSQPMSETSQLEFTSDLGVGLYNAEHWRLGMNLLVENYMHSEMGDPIGTLYYGGLVDLESVAGQADKVAYLAAGVVGYAKRFDRNLELGLDFLVGVGSAAMMLYPGDGVGNGPFGLQERWFDRTMPRAGVDYRTLDPSQPGLFTNNSSDPGLVLLLRAGFNFGMGRGSFVIY